MSRMPNGDLTPYDTGERAQPLVWVSADVRRPAEDERDRYGKVDFEDDASETLATVHVERVETCHIAVVYSAKTNTELRVNLDADLDVLQERIENPEGVVAAVVQALRDRGADVAADLVANTDPDDDLWNNYIGPMLDELQQDYTAMGNELAAEMSNLSQPIRSVGVDLDADEHNENL